VAKLFNRGALQFNLSVKLITTNLKCNFKLRNYQKNSHGIHMKNLIAGNWKLKGSPNLADSYISHLSRIKPDNCIVVVCPTHDLLGYIYDKWSNEFGHLGAQDCFHDDTNYNDGLGTPDEIVSRGAKYIILGHSDRRNKCHETSELVRKKVNLAWNKGLIPIVCVGEESGDRKGNLTQIVVNGQIADSIDFDNLRGPFVIAYEPVWAIGSGNIPTMEEIGEVHDEIRKLLITLTDETRGGNTPLLYGGSADVQNASSILAVENVNGLLIGGASLNIQTFGTIIDCA